MRFECVARWLAVCCLIGACAASFPSLSGTPPVDRSAARLFARFEDKRSLSERAMNAVGLTSEDMGRSFALVAGVSSYPALSPSDLQPAAEDIAKLVDYLVRVEQFDEVVVLKNEDMNLSNLSFFLQSYFPERLRRFPKSRFLLAYSGHGFNDGSRGYLLQSNARTFNDKQNSVNLQNLRVFVDEVVDAGHGVLVLLNSCYSGAFVARQAFGNSQLEPKHPGAHAITAGGTRELAWHDAQVGAGSVFFEKFFAGLDGRADRYPAGGDGLVTAEELFAYLRTEVQVSTQQRQNPLFGDITREGAAGSFYFLNREHLVGKKLVPEWRPPVAVAFAGPAPNRPQPQQSGQSPAINSPSANSTARDTPPTPPPQANGASPAASKGSGSSQDVVFGVEVLPGHVKAIVRLNGKTVANPRAIAGRIGKSYSIDVSSVGYQSKSLKLKPDKGAPDTTIRLEPLAPIDYDSLKGGMATLPAAEVELCLGNALAHSDSLSVCVKHRELALREGTLVKQRVTTFRMGVEEVPVAHFRRFVDETGYVTTAERLKDKNGNDCWNMIGGGGSDPPIAVSWRWVGFAQTPQDPVVCVSSQDIDSYIEWLSQKTGARLRLPQEIEWQYAAYGTGVAAVNVDEPSICSRANIQDLSVPNYFAVKPPCSDGFRYTAPVGALPVNARGIRNLLGNVWELMNDCYSFPGTFSKSTERPVEAIAPRARGQECQRAARGSGYTTFYLSVDEFRDRYFGPDPLMGFRLVEEI